MSAPQGNAIFSNASSGRFAPVSRLSPLSTAAPSALPAPQPRHHRDALDKLDGKVVPLKRTAALPEEGAGAADGDVVLSAGESVTIIRLKAAAHLNLAAARLQLEENGVAQADRLHHHVHLMVAVWQLPHNVQREVDLAGGVDLDAVHQIPPFKPGRGCGWPSPGTSRGSSSSGCSACSGCGPCPARCG